MSKWLILALAIVSEVIGTSFLKASDGFTKLGPAVMVVLGYGVSFYLLSIAIRLIPIGIAYAIWSGVGVTLIAIIGWVFFGQRLDLPAIVGMVMIVGGVIVLNGFSGAVSH